MNNNTGRKRVRRARKTANIKRILLTVCMMAMVAALSIGGTLAWLTDSSTEVKNTFEASNIDIALKESPLNNEDGTYGTPAEDTDNEYKIIPGKEYKKDPTVSVNEEVTDVDIYLFVEFAENGNPADYYTYTSLLNADNGWTLLAGTSNVWYRIVEVEGDTKSWALLKDDKIVVKNTVAKEDMTDAAAAELVYNAYAIQYDEIKAADGLTAEQVAWQTASGKTITTTP